MRRAGVISRKLWAIRDFPADLYQVRDWPSFSPPPRCCSRQQRGFFVQRWEISIKFLPLSSSKGWRFIISSPKTLHWSCPPRVRVGTILLTEREAQARHHSPLAKESEHETHNSFIARWRSCDCHAVHDYCMLRQRRWRSHRRSTGRQRSTSRHGSRRGYAVNITRHQDRWLIRYFCSHTRAGFCPALFHF